MTYIMRLQVRYAAVRRQIAARAGGLEVHALDYHNTAADLLPLLEQACAHIFTVCIAALSPSQHQSCSIQGCASPCSRASGLLQRWALSQREYNSECLWVV